MSYEMLVGLEVSDDQSYSNYRAAMMPLLEKYNGKFRYDFAIADVLKQESPNPINRVFVIAFPDQQSKEHFFSDVDYVLVKKKYFEGAVKARTVISEYEI